LEKANEKNHFLGKIVKIGSLDECRCGRIIDIPHKTLDFFPSWHLRACHEIGEIHFLFILR